MSALNVNQTIYLLLLVNIPARPRPRMSSPVRSRLSVEKSKFYDRLREISHCGPRCGNIWKAIKMQPYDTTSPISLTHSLWILYNWWHYYQRKTNIHKIVRFSSTISRHARLARARFHLFFFCKICFNFLKFYAFSIETMTEMMIRVTAPLSPSSQCEFDMILTSRPIGYMHYIQYMCVYSQPINVYFEYSFSVLLWFICSCSCPQVAPPVRCSSGGLYDL